MSGPPKPVIAIAVLALAGGGYWYFNRTDESAQWLGYVAAETAYVAAPVSGRLAKRPVNRGEAVEAGAVLFSLDPETADADAARAEAQVAAAAAQQADLAQARQRAPELAVSRAAEAAASAQLTKVQADFNRVDALARRGFASRSQLDAARAARDGAAANLAQTRAQIASGELTAGRQGQIAAAGADVAASQAALRAQRQRRREIAPVAPEKGVVEQTFYNPGEWVPANAPVVSVLPDARRKLRFYVPQDRIAALRPGMTVTYSCDGCGAARQARISYIAPRAEFTPPVIYSERARAKLVFLVEAALPAEAKPLPPGLPVEVVPQ
ncbi:MAG: secretion protein HlyD [Novosphingobium sp.]|nr:secretion protein HlyD [Novosphingobium sp.]MBX9644355.1 HlyD family efflux transporter periplasmic adaptor subunit [Novosphingobium sp.]